MTSATTKTFRSGNSEAVRLPRDLAFGIGVELTLEREGDVVTLRPKKAKTQDLKALVAALRRMPKPSAIQERDELGRPGRKGL